MHKVRMLVACALMALATVAVAQYPSKPVKIIVLFAIGGTGDIMARMVAIKITEQTGKPFVVENRTDAGRRIGCEAAAKKPGDGYTLAAMDVAVLYGTQDAVRRMTSCQ